MANQLNIFFFPILARGHMIPTLGVAKLLAERGVRATIVTTPGNASVFSSTIDAAVTSGHSMQLLLIPFPDVGLPSGCESTFAVTSETDKMKVFQAMAQLEHPLQQLLSDRQPDCLVGDISTFDSWTARVARSAGIRYVEFSAFSAFSGVVIEKSIPVFLSRCDNRVSGTVGPLVGLPHRIELTRTEMPTFFNHLDQQHGERERPAVIINTFRELEPEYVELMEEGGRRKVWCVGPVHLDKIKNCTGNDQNWEGIKKWLDSRERESVLYVSFGSECQFKTEQLREIAIGLEASLQPFVWVVRPNGGGAETMFEWLPEGFGDNVAGRGLILTEWAPQTSIMNHPAIGGSMVHCGWNTSIEVISAGLPVIAWPLHAEQFINERQFVEVLETGVRVFHGETRIIDPEKRKLLGGEKVKEAVLRLFGEGEEAKEMRRKAKEYGKLARSAMEEGGSSALDINCFVQELTELTQERRNITATISN